MAFAGWPAEAVEFYDGLLADNSKTYWQAHRATYDECVRAPMLALLAELEAEFGTGKIFRPYRDVRFSADKTPYKTHLGASLEGGGYVQLGPDGLAGSGRWHMEPDVLGRYRAAVADERAGATLAALIEQLRGKGVDIIAREALKRVPRGYDSDHPRADLLRRKGLAAWRDFGVGPWLGTRKAKERVVEFLRAAQPLNDWLAKHAG